MAMEFFRSTTFTASLLANFWSLAASFREAGSALQLVIETGKDTGWRSVHAASVNKNRCWDHALYLSADNNLEAAAVQDMKEMLRNPSLPRLLDRYHFRVLVERSRKGKSRREKSDGFTDAPIPGGLGYDPAYNVYAELSEGMGFRKNRSKSSKQSPLTKWQHLMSFSTQALPVGSGCFQFLELWDHGMGSFGFGSSDDFKDAEPMEVKDIARALSMSRPAESPLDLLGFDSCLMSSYEVLEVLSPFTKFTLASEETEPGHGWDYRTLDANAGTIEEFGVDLIQGFIRSSKQSPRTLGLISSEGFRKFQEPMNELCDRFQKLLGSGFNSAKIVLGRARQYALSFGSAVDKPGKIGSHVDLGSFLDAMSKLLPNSWLYERTLVWKALNIYGRKKGKKQFHAGALFVFRDFGTEALRSGYTGMSVFWPEATSGDLRWKFNLYEDGLGTLGAWGKMLIAYFKFKHRQEAVYLPPPQTSAETPEEQEGRTPVEEDNTDASDAEDHAPIGISALTNKPGKEISLYGRLSRHVIAVKLYYGYLYKEGKHVKMQLAGLARPDMTQRLKKTDEPAWWLDIFGFDARLKTKYWSPRVVIMEETQNDLRTHSNPELVKIPVNYYAADNHDDGYCSGDHRVGYLIGSVTGDGSIEKGTQWTLYVQSRSTGSITAVRRSWGNGSIAPLRLRLAPGSDPQIIPRGSSERNCVLWSQAKASPLLFDRSPGVRGLARTLSIVFRVETVDSKVRDFEGQCKSNAGTWRCSKKLREVIVTQNPWKSVQKAKKDSWPSGQGQKGLQKRGGHRAAQRVRKRVSAGKKKKRGGPRDHEDAASDIEDEDADSSEADSHDSLDSSGERRRRIPRNSEQGQGDDKPSYYYYSGKDIKVVIKR